MTRIQSPLPLFAIEEIAMRHDLFLNFRWFSGFEEASNNDMIIHPKNQSISDYFENKKFGNNTEEKLQFYNRYLNSILASKNMYSILECKFNDLSPISPTPFESPFIMEIRNIGIIHAASFDYRICMNSSKNLNYYPLSGQVLLDNSLAFIDFEPLLGDHLLYFRRLIYLKSVLICLISEKPLSLFISDFNSLALHAEAMASSRGTPFIKISIIGMQEFFTVLAKLFQLPSDLEQIIKSIHTTKYLSCSPKEPLRQDSELNEIKIKNFLFKPQDSIPTVLIQHPTKELMASPKSHDSCNASASAQNIINDSSTELNVSSPSPNESYTSQVFNYADGMGDRGNISHPQVSEISRSQAICNKDIFENSAENKTNKAHTITDSNKTEVTYFSKLSSNSETTSKTKVLSKNLITKHQKKKERNKAIKSRMNSEGSSSDSSETSRSLNLDQIKVGSKQPTADHTLPLPEIYTDSNISDNDWNYTLVSEANNYIKSLDPIINKESSPSKEKLDFNSSISTNGKILNFDIHNNASDSDFSDNSDILDDILKLYPDKNDSSRKSQNSIL